MTPARVTGLGAAAGTALLLWLLFHPPPLPWAQTLRLTLEAASFGELNPRASVELAGAKVGVVEGLDLEDGRARIHVSVERRYARLLHADTSAEIRPHGLLGPRYVQLDGGGRGQLADGATIPISRVHVATDLDQVLDALQPEVRRNLQALIVELGSASDGRGQDVNEALRALGSATDDLAAVTATLHRRDQDIARSVVAAERLNRDLQEAPLDAQIRDTARVLRALVEVEAAIGHGIDHTATTLQALDVVLDGNSGNLARALDEAPGTVTRLRAVLASVNGLVDTVNPALPSLMTAIVETRSSFSGADANGHFVRVMALSGPCSAGVGLGCASPGTPGAGSDPSATPVPVPTPARSRLSDQELLRLFLGDL